MGIATQQEAKRFGYKQTEVGLIPEDWEVARLGDIASIATGNTPPTRDAANYGDEFLFVSPADLGELKYITRTEKMLSKKGFAISRSFPKDSILFVCIGSTIGKCGIAPTELTSNQQINAIFPSSAYSTNYLYYAVSAVAPKIRALAGQQAVPIVNKSQFSETVVPLPLLPEQRAIAGVVNDVDELMGTLDKLIAKKRDLKQAAMQQLLTGKQRLPGFTGEWEVKSLQEGVKLLSGHHVLARHCNTDGLVNME
jgi:type I restriction enzyme S subunit